MKLIGCFKFAVILRNTFAISLLIVFLIQQSFQAVLILSWTLNRTEIAATICAKSNLAENDCQGFCVLKSKLNAIENPQDKQKDQQGSKSLLPIEEVFNFNVNLFENDFLPIVNEDAEVLPIHQLSLYTYLFLTEIYAPPKTSLA